jgi:hypothetical protein
MIAASLIALAVQLAIPVAVVVLVVRAVARRRQGEVGTGHGVRRFFQYLLLLGLLVVVLSGVTGLLDLAVGPAPRADLDATLARNLTFTVVGGGLLAVVVAWTRQLHRADPGEAVSLGWTAYLTLAALVTAVVTAVQLGLLVTGLLRDGRLDLPALASGVLWGGAWAVHWRLAGRALGEPRMLPLLALGSLIGWVAGLVGLVGVLAALLAATLPGAQPLFTGADTGLDTGTGVLAAGILVWAPHGARRLRSAPAGWLWLGYMLVLGVGASLVMTLAGTSVLVYRLGIWAVGAPGGGDVVEHLRGLPTPVAVACVGALSWWYHRRVLAAGVPGGRTEVTRVHEYLLSGLALTAAGIGIALLVVALIDAVAPAADRDAGATVEVLVAGSTLLVVGGPLWWVFWRRVVRARAMDPVAEVASPTRRVYLVLLFGVTGLVAVVVVLVAGVILVDDALRLDLGARSVRDARVPLGILLAAGAVCGYHWAVQRRDRAVVVPPPVPRVRRRVLLVGPRDEELAGRIRELTGAGIEGWVADGPDWDRAAVLEALAVTTAPQVLLLSGPQGLQVVEAGRGADPGAPDPARPRPSVAPSTDPG